VEGLERRGAEVVISTAPSAPGRAVVSVAGEVDASNAHEFVDHVLRAATRAERLVVAQTRPQRMSVATSASGGEAENICSPEPFRF